MITKQTRTPYRLPSAGPYLATVINHLDPTYMGGLEVSIIKGYTNDPNIKSQSFVVQYLNPFYGVTREGAKQRPNWKDFKETQSSYGMWMIPPDIGTTVICFFIEGETQNGFWIGCVQEDFQNFMIPGLAAAEYPESELTEEQKKKYGTNYLPSAEFNKFAPDNTYNSKVIDPAKKLRPIHPFADRLIEQGLLLDKVRGVTSSSARREVPSAVFGISTPGPLNRDPGATRDYIGGYDNQRQVPLNRKGGSTFVMDDGDVNGDNELVRIRTRTGHQILLHNTADLIYIANSKGTAWIELTSQGKIDIFAQDSVSIHTETDFNFRADRDVNIEAMRSLRMFSNGGIEITTNGDRNTNIKGDDKILVNGTTNLTSIEGIKFSTSGNLNLKSNNSFIQSTLESNFLSAGATKITASILGLNGATPASPASNTNLPLEIITTSLPSTKSSSGWENKKFYNNGTINSITQRVPMHEPWIQHESFNPIRFSFKGTDIRAPADTSSNIKIPLNPNQPEKWYDDKEFIEKVKVLAAKNQVNYIDLLSVMYFETGGTLNPNTPNGSVAIGLIQFTDVAIEEINKRKGSSISKEYLGGLTRSQQLDWVDAYFTVSDRWNKLKGPARSIDDLYMAVLWPDAIGKPDNYVLFQNWPTAYIQNSGLDLNNDGLITKIEAADGPKKQIPIVKKILGVS